MTVRKKRMTVKRIAKHIDGMIESLQHIEERSGYTNAREFQAVHMLQGAINELQDLRCWMKGNKS